MATMAYASPPDQPRRVTSVVRADSRTGKLVRSLVVSGTPVATTVIQARAVTMAPEPEPGPVPAGINETVARIAAEQSLSAQLIHSVIKVESNYNPYAVSNKGALGLMQLIPETARRFGVKNVFNPAENIQGGAKYLRYLLDIFDQNYPLAIAAYNAGEAAVARYGGIPPFAETQNYVALVRRQLELARKADAAKNAAIAAAKPVAAVAAVKEDGPARMVELPMPDGSVRYVTR
jgi:hypothetical protein